MVNKVFSKKQRAIHQAIVVQGDLSTKTVQRDVEIMAIHGVWVMVRRAGCVPYVCNAREVTILD